MRRALAAWTLAGALALGLGADAVYRARPAHPRSDLPVYLAAARALSAGAEPVGVRSEARGWPYYYPPTLAALLVPLAGWPLQAAAAAWFAASAGALVAGAVAARRALAAAKEPEAWDRWDAAGLALAALPSASALLRGQLGPLLLGLSGGGLLLLARRRDAAAGALLGLAAAIKLVPGVAVAGLLLGRRWRAAAAAAAATLAATLLLPAPWLGLAGAARSTGRALEVLVAGPLAEPERLRPGGAPVEVHIPTNQALASQAIRRTGPGPLRGALLAALALVVLGAALAPAARGGDPAGPASLAAWLAVPLLLAPVAWHHHHVALAPLGLVLAARARRGERLARAGLALGLALSTLHFAVDPLRGLGLLGWGTLAALLALAGGSVERGVEPDVEPTPS